MCEISILYWILLTLLSVTMSGLCYYILRYQKLESELIKAHEEHLKTLMRIKGQLNDGI